MSPTPAPNLTVASNQARKHASKQARNQASKQACKQASKQAANQPTNEASNTPLWPVQATVEVNNPGTSQQMHLHIEGAPAPSYLILLWGRCQEGATTKKKRHDLSILKSGRGELRWPPPVRQVLDSTRCQDYSLQPTQCFCAGALGIWRWCFFFWFRGASLPPTRQSSPPEDEHVVQQECCQTCAPGEPANKYK